MMVKKIPQACAIIVAAGESRRMNGTDKIFAPLGGKPVLARAVQPFQDCPFVDRIVLVVNSRRREQCLKIVAEESWSKVSNVCAGGERRADSVYTGLEHIGNCEWVIIHDGARPLVTLDLIAPGLEAAKETGAAVAAVPVKDTIKIAGDDRIVRKTPVRQTLWAAQTPQVFRFDIITEAYRRIEKQNDITDDASLVERLGYKVRLYTGSYRNIKITTPDDLVLAELLWKRA